MKILWFALTPCGASEQLSQDSQGGGWLSSLEKQLVNTENVELHICFQWSTDIPTFSNGRVTYHPVRRIRIQDTIIGQLLGGGFRQDPVRQYADVISRVNPDLIHVHGTEEAFGLIQSVTKIPVIISIQGILSNYTSKYFSGVSFIRLMINERLINHLKLKSALSLYIIFKANAKRERKILSMTRHIIGRTDWDRRSTAVLAPNSQYHHGDEILRAPFYNGIWARQNFSSPLRIVTVSSIAPYKGFETVLNVSKILQEQVGFNFIWTVVGLSSSDSVVKTVYRWLGPNDKVQLLGTHSGNDIRDILLDSDIYCQVSHIENSPNSLCEAMLLGMPIVANFAGGTDSMLCAGKEGILVQDGDPWSMAGAILELSRNFQRSVQMGQAARVRALVRHNPDRIVKDLLTTYRLVSQNDTSNPQ